MLITLIKSVYGAMAVVFSFFFVADLSKTNLKKEPGNIFISGLIGGIAYFFDTLGIGSFATSTTMLRLTKQVPDKTLPGTLNVSCVLPTLLEAFIFIGIIQVDLLTLVCMVTAASIGSWMGAGVVAKLPEQKIRVGLATALLITATFLLAKQLHLVPLEHAGAIGLTGIKLGIAVVGSCIIGIITAMGIGMFAPFLALSALLGLSSRAIFPIMMSAVALGCGFAGIKFIKAGAYDRKVTLAMTVVAMFGVLLAAYVVKSLPLEILTWVVVGVIYYAALSLLYTAYHHRKTVKAANVGHA